MRKRRIPIVYDFAPVPEPVQYTTKIKSVRLHNRRVTMFRMPSGEYQIHLKKLIDAEHLAELRRDGFTNKPTEWLIKDRILMTVLVLSPEAIASVVACYEALLQDQQRKRT